MYSLSPGRISIHAPRVGSDPGSAARSAHSAISIHAPRVGSDTEIIIFAPGASISIHAPRVGSDRSRPTPRRRLQNFNPRSPCGERQIRPAGRVPCPPNFNPRSPCGERQPPPPGLAGDGDFNPRSPCGERLHIREAVRPGRIFQSTLPVWGATGPAPWVDFPKKVISIHAPRVGSDAATLGPSNSSSGFQSTLPVWGATQSRRVYRSPKGISIHAPRVGSDATGPGRPYGGTYFNPRSPCGERQQNCTNTS